MKKKLIAGILVLATLVTPTTALAEGGSTPPGPLMQTNTSTTVTPPSN